MNAYREARQAARFGYHLGAVFIGALTLFGLEGAFY
jgi:hypothetical protein